MLSTLPMDTQPDATGRASADTLPRFDAFRSTLSPSLLSDLQRFSEDPGGTDLLPAVAASVRHGRPLVLHLLSGPDLLRLSVFPHHRLFHCRVDVSALEPAALATLHLVYVEPERALSPDRRLDPVIAAHFLPLDGLLWGLALQTGTGELLPEIRGRVRYRLSPGFSSAAAALASPVESVVRRLARGSVSLDELVRETRVDRELAQRTLNAVYLQAGLIVSRMARRAVSA